MFQGGFASWVGRLAELRPKQQSAHSLTTTLSVSASLSASDSLSVFLIDANVERRWTHSVCILCRAASTHGAFLAIPPYSVWIPSMHEPSGFDRSNGKWPDGITVYPYSRGCNVLWDTTCVNTFASSNLIRATLATGFFMDVIVRSNNNPVNDMTALMSGLINDLDKAIKSKRSKSMFGKWLEWIVKVDYHVTNKSWEAVYVIKTVRQLFSKHKVSKIVLSVWWRVVQTVKM